MKVLVAIPTGESSRHARFTDYVNMLELPKGSSSVAYARGHSPAKGRNVLIKAALDQDYEYILFFDDDIVMPADTFYKLSAHGLDMVTGLYLMRNYPHRPIIFDVVLSDGKCAWHYLEEGEKGLIPVMAAGLGCCLIRTDVFRKMKEPWITIGQMDPEDWADDIHFFSRAREAGYQLYCDLDVKCGHMGNTTILPFQQPDGKWLVAYDTMGADCPSFPMSKMSDTERLEREKLCLLV